MMAVRTLNRPIFHPRICRFATANITTTAAARRMSRCVEGLPETMRAVHIRLVGSNGGPEALELTELPLPWNELGTVTTIASPTCISVEFLLKTAVCGNHVLIKVAAAGVNRPDVLQRQGKYPPPPGHSPLPGLEVSGVVVAAGKDVPLEGQDGARFVLGETNVCALANGGGYAEYVAVPAGQCLAIPASLTVVHSATTDDPTMPSRSTLPSTLAATTDTTTSSIVTKDNELWLTAAACIPESYFTVWHNLFQQCNIFGDTLLNRESASPKPTVLVHGGTSGIGTTALMLCSALGINVLTTAGTDAKCKAASRLFCNNNDGGGGGSGSAGAGGGLITAINYNTTPEWQDVVLEETNGKGVDVVLDMVCGSYLQKNLSTLSVGGRVAVIGSHGGYEATPDLNLLNLMRKRLTVGGSTLRGRSAKTKQTIATELGQVAWPLFDNGKLGVVLDSVFELEDAAEAHRRMESSNHIGKIALKIA